MCEPTLLVMGVSAAASAYSASKQAQAQNDANEYNAGVMDRNAAIAESSAKEAERTGESDALRAFGNARNVVGEQKGIQAKSGVVVGSGSAGDVTQSSFMAGDMDAMKIKANAAKEAQGLRLQSQNMVEEARMQRSKYVSPGEAAGVSLLSNAGGMASRFVKPAK